MKMLKLVLVIAFSFILLGCSGKTRPIDEPVYSSSLFTSAQIEKAILDAGKGNRGWVLRKQRDGLITGTLIKGRYTVEIEIPYSASGYTIKYKNSTNLKSDGKRIHGSYNRWVANLNNDIYISLAHL